MRLMIFELLTVGAMVLCVIFEWYSLRFMEGTDEDGGEIIWTMFAERTGSARREFLQTLMRTRVLNDSIPLSEGTYIVGNRFFNDIYLDASGPVVKLYLNVQRGKVYVSILKGHVSIDNYTCYADQTNRYEIPEFSNLRVADVEIQFCRKKVN